jgi:hypothetical protein
VAERHIYKVTHMSDLPRLLDRAATAPVEFEREGVRFQLVRQPDQDSAPLANANPSTPSPATDVLAVLADVRAQLREMLGEERFQRLAMHDSTETVGASRIERSADLLRASGNFSPNDPIWQDVARQTVEKFTRVRDTVFGSRVLTNDSTDLIGDERERRSTSDIE